MAVVGSAGTGGTTLVDLVLRLHELDVGRIALDAACATCVGRFVPALPGTTAR